MIFKFGVTFSAQALRWLPVVTCSLAQCFAELPSTHTHAAAIALPPPASRAVARAAAEGCSNATRQQERTAVASAAEAQPDPAAPAPGRPSLVALPPEVLRGVLQVGARVRRVTTRGEISPAAHIKGSWLHIATCCPGSQGAAMFGCGGEILHEIPQPARSESAGGREGAGRHLLIWRETLYHSSSWSTPHCVPAAGGESAGRSEGAGGHLPAVAPPGGRHRAGPEADAVPAPGAFQLRFCESHKAFRAWMTPFHKLVPPHAAACSSTVASAWRHTCAKSAQHLSTAWPYRLQTRRSLKPHLSWNPKPHLSWSPKPHLAQEVAVRWMLQREGGTAAAPHPTLAPFSTAQGLPLWLCAGGGDAFVEPLEPCAPCRGGFVCDEPASLQS